MSDISANLSLPYIQPSQAQKHVTHNEGMRRLDILVQMAVLAADETPPPTSPNDGDRYIIPAGATGDWSGNVGKVAVFENGGWVFYSPNSGWTTWVENLGEQHVYDGANWVLASPTQELQNLDHVGISTTADATNRLAVASDATLFTHAGSNHQLKINKAATGDTASLLFQTNWSGRAEMGIVGTDDFEIKVSANGSTFNTAMIANAATGKVNFPAGIDGLTLPEFGESPMVNINYLNSRDGDLVANSTGILGNNYNYPSEYVLDQIVTPNLPASFSFAGYYQSLTTMSDIIAINPNHVYKTQSYIRQEGIPGDWSAYANEERHVQYMGLAFYDADQILIRATHHKRYKHGGAESMTTLAAPLTPGDMNISLVDANGWNETSASSSNRGVIIFEYKNSFGRVCDYYSRLVEFDLFDLGQVDKTTNIATLNNPFPTSLGNPDDANGTWPIGTKIANSSSGDSFKYTYYNGLSVPDIDQWYQAKGFIGGIDTSGTGYEFNFPPGTAYVQPIWFPNYSNRPGGYSGRPDTGSNHKVWNAGVSIIPEPLAAQSEVLSGSTAGKKEIKVPDLDFSTGTISLTTAALSITPV